MLTDMGYPIWQGKPIRTVVGPRSAFRYVAPCCETRLTFLDMSVNASPDKLCSHDNNWFDIVPFVKSWDARLVRRMTHNGRFRACIILLNTLALAWASEPLPYIEGHGFDGKLSVSLRNRADMSDIDLNPQIRNEISLGMQILRR